MHEFLSSIESILVQHVFLAFYWLAMSHAIVNPVVYFLMNPT